MPYDPQQTRQQVFDAATAEFAAHGFAGARVARIAERSGVNKQAIYFYFGDKLGLFTAVLQQRLTALAEALADTGGPVAYALNQFDYFRAHPADLRLFLWEALEFGDTGPFPGEDIRAGHYRGRIARLRQAQQDGAIDPGLPPVPLWLAISGIVCWYLTARQLTRMTLGHDPGDADLDTERSFIQQAVQRLISPEAAPTH